MPRDRQAHQDAQAGMSHAASGGIAGTRRRRRRDGHSPRIRPTPCPALRKPECPRGAARPAQRRVARPALLRVGPPHCRRVHLAASCGRTGPAHCSPVRTRGYPGLGLPQFQHRRPVQGHGQGRRAPLPGCRSCDTIKCDGAQLSCLRVQHAPGKVERVIRDFIHHALLRPVLHADGPVADQAGREQRRPA